MINLIHPKLQATFNEYQRSCPFNTKARCGRYFCNHDINKGKKNTKCVEYNCPFYKEDSKLMKNKNSRGK